MFKEEKPRKEITHKEYKECFELAQSEMDSYNKEFKTRLNNSAEVRATFESTLAILEKDLGLSRQKNKGENFLLDMILQHNAATPMLEFLFDEKQMLKFTENDFIYKAMGELLAAYVADGMIITNADMRLACNKAFDVMQDALEQKTREDVIKDVVNGFFDFVFPLDGTITYTPTEIVDFINRSVQYVLKEQFGETLGSEHVEILDPFSGTGIFNTRFITCNLLTPEEAKRQFLGPKGDGKDANVSAYEIMLVGYYVSVLCINENLEEKIGEELPSFKGVRLTDTFLISEEQARAAKEKEERENPKPKKKRGKSSPNKTTKKVKQ